MGRDSEAERDFSLRFAGARPPSARAPQERPARSTRELRGVYSRRRRYRIEHRRQPSIHFAQRTDLDCKCSFQTRLFRAGQLVFQIDDVTNELGTYEPGFLFSQFEIQSSGGVPGDNPPQILDHIHSRLGDGLQECVLLISAIRFVLFVDVL